MKTIPSLLAAAVAVCAAQAAFAVAPSTSTEAKQAGPEQHAAKAKPKAPKKGKKSGAA
jgi:hypothetical protein